MNLWVLGAIVLALVSCRDERLAHDPSQSLIDGFWSTECLSREEGYVRNTYQFSYGSQVEKNHIQYGPDCQQEQSRAIYQGEYELGVTWESYIYRLEFWVKQSSLKMSDPDMANQHATCGFQGWSQKKVESTRLNLSDCPLQFSGDFFYESYFRLKDNVLILSEQFGPATESPSGFGQVDLSRTFIRAQAP